jgi:hypothetical protein
MATTTNYSWSTPDDTALVKDGAAAIRSLGTAIDTTVFTNAGAAIAKTIVDAKGDIIAATAADTVSRLAVGANDTVLTADSTAGTGLKWATPSSGGMTLLSTTSLSGATTTISSINQTYTDLKIIIRGVTNATSNGKFRIAPNGSTNISYSSGGDNNATDWRRIVGGYIVGNDFSNVTNSDNSNAWSLIISRYATSDATKQFQISGGYVEAVGGVGSVFGGMILTTSGISSLVISNSGGNLSTGTAYVYGVK